MLYWKMHINSFSFKGRRSYVSSVRNVKLYFCFKCTVLIYLLICLLRFSLLFSGNTPNQGSFTVTSIHPR